MEKVVEGFGGMEEWRKCSNFVGGKIINIIKWKN